MFDPRTVVLTSCSGSEAQYSLRVLFFTGFVCFHTVKSLIPTSGVLKIL